VCQEIVERIYPPSGRSRKWGGPKLRQHLRNQNMAMSKHLSTAGLELLAEPR
jgi:hypothetical protein